MPRRKNDGKGRLGGRTKGTPNKHTSAMRDIISRRWEEYETSGQFAQDIEMIDPVSRLSLMERYAQYIAPKMKSIDMEVSGVQTETIEETLRKLCLETPKNQGE